MIGDMLNVDFDVLPISSSEARAIMEITKGMAAASANGDGLIMAVQPDMVAPLMLTLIAGLRQTQAWADGELEIDPAKEPRS